MAFNLLLVFCFPIYRSLRRSDAAPSESESESSQRSSTGKDFEIVDADDVETS